MKAIYAAILTPKPEGGYFAAVPDVPGCVTSGKDLRDVMDNLRDALTGCLCVLEDERQPVPAPTAPEDVAHELGEVLVLADVDTDAYRQINDTQPVRKTVSIPAWMARRADQAGISLSKVLQDTLRSRLNQ